MTKKKTALIPKYTYSRVGVPDLIVHAIDKPTGEQDALLCGMPKEDLKKRAYKTYVDDLPANAMFCLKCWELLIQRYGNVYDIPEWKERGERLDRLFGD